MVKTMFSDSFFIPGSRVTNDKRVSDRGNNRIPSFVYSTAKTAGIYSV